MLRSTYRRHADESGQAFPILLVAIIGILATGAVLMQGGRLTELRASAVTSADAAALAGADAVADRFERDIVTYIHFMIHRQVPPSVVSAARAAAADYAQRNGATLVSPATVRRVDARTIAVDVVTRTDRRLGRPATNDAMADTRGSARATAVIEFTGFRGPGGGGPQCLTGAEVQALIDRHSIDPAPTSSGLTSCSVDVRGLQEVMHVAILRIEGEYGRLTITSGYRSMEQQAAMYAAWLVDPNPPYPVAPPGASMHNYGLAFDVPESQGISVYNFIGRSRLENEFNLCWGGNWAGSSYDPVHFEYCPNGVRLGALGLSPEMLASVGVVVDDPKLVDPRRL
ncbi:M15 family metallopeptidase [Nitriliruptor alkaliphilus]|uniref:M15 family metallopeptidase n=1 Tax=Nitriliruptor alkaliphilus TaxID=427918 RepID=UPI0012EEB22A|nr:M15 family metallopeptidase [Nitriliruptor alkaliphilus]